MRAVHWGIIGLSRRLCRGSERQGPCTLCLTQPNDAQLVWCKSPIVSLWQEVEETSEAGVRCCMQPHNRAAS